MLWVLTGTVSLRQMYFHLDIFMRGWTGGREYGDKVGGIGGGGGGIVGGGP